MLDELEEIVDFMIKEHKKSNERWRNSEYYSKMNLNKIKVKELLNSKKLENILNYREFININNINLMQELKEKFAIGNTKILNRVKLKNSVEDKIVQYNTEKHENGQIPVDKCLNDLFGVRAIYDSELDYEIVRRFIEEKFPNNKIKCVNRNIKNDEGILIYKAIHLYFKEDNYNFQWELQIWNAENELMNFTSHEEYKQRYIVWEDDNKGGVL